MGAKVNELIKAGQYYRFITCMFLHGGLAHIGFNMYALYNLGPIMESYYGKLKFFVIYMVSGVISSLFSYFLSNSVSIGASGAIFGLLGAFLILTIKLKDKIGKKFRNNVLFVIFINMILGITIPNIDIFGHLGGFIGGFIVALIIT